MTALPAASLPVRPMPRASAQVAPYVECLGAELHIPAKPRETSPLRALVGDEALARMTAHRRIGEYVARVPLAKRWLVLMLHWQGHSGSQIARILRTSNVTVRKYISEGRVA